MLVFNFNQEFGTKLKALWCALGYRQQPKRKNRSDIDYLDVSVGTSWQANNYDTIRKKYDLIRYYQKKRMHVEKYLAINEYEQELERYYNDQTIHTIPEPIAQTIKFDRVVNSGRTLAASLITGERGDRFDYLALGTAQTPVTDADYKLYNEILRVNVIQNGGFISAAGSIIKHSGLISPGEISMVVYEYGFVNLPIFDPDQMFWNRTVFDANKGVDHNQGQDFFSITNSVWTSSSA